MTAVGFPCFMAAPRYRDLIAEAMAEFKDWERRLAKMKHKRGGGRGRRQKVDPGLAVTDLGMCPCCGRPAVIKGMCRPTYLKWHRAQQKAQRSG